jgi:hypothetical protein
MTLVVPHHDFKWIETAISRSRIKRQGTTLVVPHHDFKRIETAISRSRIKRQGTTLVVPHEPQNQHRALAPVNFTWPKIPFPRPLEPLMDIFIASGGTVHHELLRLSCGRNQGAKTSSVRVAGGSPGTIQSGPITGLFTP